MNNVLLVCEGKKLAENEWIWIWIGEQIALSERLEIWLQKEFGKWLRI